MPMQIQNNAAVRNEAVRPDVMYRAEDTAAQKQREQDRSLIGDDNQLVENQQAFQVDLTTPPPPPEEVEFPPQPPAYAARQEQATQNQQNQQVQNEEEVQPTQISARPITNVADNVQDLSNVAENETQPQRIEANTTT